MPNQVSGVNSVSKNLRDFLKPLETPSLRPVTCLIYLLACLMTYTHVLKIFMSLLTCTQAEIANTLQALTTHYEFTCEFLHSLFNQE